MSEGREGEGETHLVSFLTSENIQYQGSWTDKLICLHSISFLIYYEQTFNEGIIKQGSTTTMHRLRTLRNSASCRQNDKFIRTTTAFTQYTRKKGKTLFSLNLTHIPNYSSFKMDSNVTIYILRHLMLIFVTRWILWMHVDIQEFSAIS